MTSWEPDRPSSSAQEELGVVRTAVLYSSFNFPQLRFEGSDFLVPSSTVSEILEYSLVRVNQDGEGWLTENLVLRIDSLFHAILSKFFLFFKYKFFLNLNPKLLRGGDSARWNPTDVLLREKEQIGSREAHFESLNALR